MEKYVRKQLGIATTDSDSDDAPNQMMAEPEVAEVTQDNEDTPVSGLGSTSSLE